MAVADGVRVGVALGVRVGVALGVTVGVGVTDGVKVAVGVGVRVGVADGVKVGVAVGVGGASHAPISQAPSVPRVTPFTPNGVHAEKRPPRNAGDPLPSG